MNTLPRKVFLVFMTYLTLTVPSISSAQQASAALSGPNATPNILNEGAQEKNDVLGVNMQQSFDEWKAGIKRRSGLDFGFDYNALGYTASSSLADSTSASGAFRLYGTWDLIDRDGPNTGSLIFKFENRHSFSDVPPTGFNAELGYAGLVSSVFSDQGWRATHLYWQQEFAQGRGVAYLGWLDVTDFVDVYALASPWSGFSNLAFQTGSGTIGGLPDGALGGMVGGFLSNNVYVASGIADANADPTDLLGGFDTLFDAGETFKSLEVGWTTGAEALFVNNAHLTFWHIDDRQAAGTSEGHGVAFSFTHSVDGAWLPFIRGGWADGGGSLYEAAVSIGTGYSADPSRSLTGIGVNWSRPNQDTFGGKLDNQLAVEAFHKIQLTEGFEITPSLQLIKNPALNPVEDTIALFGLRMRMAF
ncbi:carbohydrate porin [Pseudophaeobacter flagellatus]|uniref:carbohydrate porin n=1 Tax=Pseudophaeobacter flagellatus TaxID=2899119 RepID=UPI001E2C9E33|nr:carbohydrate porin [Pseudophaeobacter flagellatus]MCD9149276.1 carbohydrate porin [Pseudophaeobacter flagellatus]